MKTVRTWWGKRFIEALESFTDTARLTRGRGYATNERILSWNLGPGRISAIIRGNANPYYGVYEEPLYQTHIRLPLIDASDWAEVMKLLGGQAAFVARLLLNEVPANIEEPFKTRDLNLLPRRAADLKTDCSCPDYENPCKHIAGLCFFLAARLDQDPILLFELRGLGRDQLQQHLRQTPLGRALADALAQSPGEAEPVDHFYTNPESFPLAETGFVEDFWQGRKRLPDVVDAPLAPAVPALFVKRGGDYPAFWTRENSFIEAMEAVYEAVRKRAKTW